MTHRLTFILYLLGTLCMAMVQPVAAAPVDHIDDSDDTTLINEPPSGEPSAEAKAALRSNSYEKIGFALFSAKSQADIDALAPTFDRLRERQYGPSLVMRPTAVDDVIAYITGDKYLTGKMNMSMYGQLKKGDILLRRTGRDGCKQWDIIPLCKYWALVYEHSGIYYGVRNGKPSVYESSNIGGVQFKDLDTWRTRDLYIGLQRSRVAAATISSKLEAFVKKFGMNGKTPYNYNLVDKNTERALYCSQLVWKFYQTVGVNVDSDHPFYADWLRIGYGNTLASFISRNAVAPDEIGMSSNVYRMATGWNQ
ncbi:MAG: hypothetical protein RLY87_491 [Chloroflexota bacterium]|jgi:uncharacterized protein YycO